MPALPPKLTLRPRKPMSALGQKRIRSPRACEQLRWNFKAECLCGFQVDYEFDLGRLFNRKVSGGFAN
jgi:hypothetical protein